MVKFGVEASGEKYPWKSQVTACFEQFPHTGCTSSHLIFLILHRWQPALLFLWDLRGGIVLHGTQDWETGGAKGLCVTRHREE